MFSFLWNGILALGLIAALPRFLYRFRKNPLLKQALLQKLGFNFPELSDKVAWIHAVSVGEVRAAAKLIELLKDDYQIVLSTTTLTGHEEAKKIVKSAVFLPLDLSFIVRKVLKRIKPSLLILVESDFWFNFMKEAKLLGAKVVLVNGKLSEKSLKGYKRFPFIAKNLFSSVDLFLLQSEDYRERFLSLGIAPEKIHITGNLKLDQEWKKGDAASISQKLGITKETKMVVFGSTHPGEELMAISAHKNLSKKFPELKLIIVPRHPERFDEVAKMIPVPFDRYSSPHPNNASVVLVDAMGLLSSLYEIATVAVVCGSFVPHVGGHNIIEPLAFKVPVIFGPYMHKQPEFTELVAKYGAGRQVHESSLADELERLLDDAARRELLGRQGELLIQENKGSTHRTVAVINSL